jgi:SIT family siderophore-iron:H+ symporter-like MFS transporter
VVWYVPFYPLLPTLADAGQFPYPTQALIQASVQHERTAIVTALYLASYSIGSALGNTIAGAIWINTLPNHILTRFNELGIADAQELAISVYGDPISFIDTNPRGQIGQPEREALMAAYGESQRYLTIAGLCISVLLVAASLSLRNPRLGDQQSFQDAEGFAVKSVDSGESKHAPGVGPGAEPENGQYVLGGDEETRVGESTREKNTQRY